MIVLLFIVLPLVFLGALLALLLSRPGLKVSLMLLGFSAAAVVLGATIAVKLVDRFSSVDEVYERTEQNVAALAIGGSLLGLVVLYAVWRLKIAGPRA